MDTPDLGALLAKAQEMQSKLTEVQQELASRSVEGNAGGGMVTAVATGSLRIREIRIEPSLLEEGDRTLLQDLVASAVNAALTNAQQMIQETMQRTAGVAMPFGDLGGAGAMGGAPSNPSSTIDPKNSGKSSA